MKRKPIRFKYVVSIILMLASSALVAAPFSDNGDGTVTDKGTGLIWQKCSAGLSGTDCATGTSASYTWNNALDYCNSLTLAGRSWRLPNVNELKGILDRTAYDPTIDTTAFPNTSPLFYWSASTYYPGAAGAWRVSFDVGVVHYRSKTFSYFVRCVSPGS